MPEYDMAGEHRIEITVHFVNDEDRIEFCRLLDLGLDTVNGMGKSIWWPKRVKDDVKSVHFVSQEDEDD